MKIEIWSDFACPFCYIGKRNFEKALSEFEGQSEVQVQWKSFQLMPDAPIDMGVDIHDMLAKKYGRSRQWAEKMNENVTGMAQEAGLAFHMEKMIPTNTFDAHRLAHLAAKHGLEDQAEEELFAAFFTEGRHLGKKETLEEIGREIGLKESEVASALDSGDFAEEVRKEIEDGISIGLQGVPFFVIDRKYAFSGAQPPDVFLKILRKAKEEARTAGDVS